MTTAPERTEHSHAHPAHAAGAAPAAGAAAAGHAAPHTGASASPCRHAAADAAGKTAFARIWAGAVRYAWVWVVALLGMAIGLGSSVVLAHVSPDGFSVAYDHAPAWHLSLGRYVNATFMWLAERIHVNVVWQQRVYLVPALALCAASLVATVALIERAWGEQLSRRHLVFAAFALLVPYVNPMMVDLLLFPEVFFPTSFALLFVPLSVSLLLDATPRRVALSALCALVWVGAYQAYLGAFVVMGAMAFSIRLMREGGRRTGSLRRAWTSFALLCGVGLFASVFDVLVTKLFVAAGLCVPAPIRATFSPAIVLDNVQKILSRQLPMLWDLMHASLPLLPAAFVLCAALALVVALRRLPASTVAFVLVTLALGYGAVWAPHLIESVAVLKVRSLLGCAWIVSAALVLADLRLGPTTGPAFALADRAGSGRTSATDRSGTGRSATRLDRVLGARAFKPVAGTVLALVMLANLGVVDRLFAEAFAGNQVDAVELQQIDRAIKRHEEQTGQKISRVAFIKDFRPQRYFDFALFRSDQLGERGWFPVQNNVEGLNAVTGSDYLRVDPTPEMKRRYLKGRDWKDFDPVDQIMFEDDLAVVPIY